MDYVKKTFFGRRKGKGMSKAKEDLLSTRMGDFEVVLPNSGKIDFAKLFDFTPKKFVFEIG